MPGQVPLAKKRIFNVMPRGKVTFSFSFNKSDYTYTVPEKFYLDVPLEIYYVAYNDPRRDLYNNLHSVPPRLWVEEEVIESTKYGWKKTVITTGELPATEDELVIYLVMQPDAVFYRFKNGSWQIEYNVGATGWHEINFYKDGIVTAQQPFFRYDGNYCNVRPANVAKNGLLKRISVGVATPVTSLTTISIEKYDGVAWVELAVISLNATTKENRMDYLNKNFTQTDLLRVLWKSGDSLNRPSLIIYYQDNI